MDFFTIFGFFFVNLYGFSIQKNEKLNSKIFSCLEKHWRQVFLSFCVVLDQNNHGEFDYLGYFDLLAF